METTANKNKHITINKIMWIRQLLISHVTFLSSSEVSVVFNSSSSSSNTDLQIRHFSHRQFLIS